MKIVRAIGLTMAGMLYSYALYFSAGVFVLGGHGSKLPLEVLLPNRLFHPFIWTLIFYYFPLRGFKTVRFAFIGGILTYLTFLIVYSAPAKLLSITKLNSGSIFLFSFSIHLLFVLFVFGDALFRTRLFWRPSIKSAKPGAVEAGPGGP